MNALEIFLNALEEKLTKQVKLIIPERDNKGNLIWLRPNGERS